MTIVLELKRVPFVFISVREARAVTTGGRYPFFFQSTALNLAILVSLYKVGSFQWYLWHQMSWTPRLAQATTPPDQSVRFRHCGSRRKWSCGCDGFCTAPSRQSCSKQCWDDSILQKKNIYIYIYIQPPRLNYRFEEKKDISPGSEIIIFYFYFILTFNAVLLFCEIQ